MSIGLECLISGLLVLGSSFVLIGAIGLYRMPDFFTRLHGPTKATTLGVGSIILASLVFFTELSGRVSLHELLIAVFLFMTAPVSAHMLARAAIQQRLPLIQKTRGRPWEEGE